MKFSTASDVWSFGITLVEMYQDGAQPYGKWKNGVLVAKVLGGFQHAQPENCPEEVYVQILLPCLANDAASRPSFETLLVWLNTEVSNVQAAANMHARAPQASAKGADMKMDPEGYLFPNGGAGAGSARAPAPSGSLEGADMKMDPEGYLFPNGGADAGSARASAPSGSLAEGAAGVAGNYVEDEFHTAAGAAAQANTQQQQQQPCEGGSPEGAGSGSGSAGIQRNARKSSVYLGFNESTDETNL